MSILLTIFRDLGLVPLLNGLKKPLSTGFFVRISSTTTIIRIGNCIPKRIFFVPKKSRGIIKQEFVPYVVDTNCPFPAFLGGISDKSCNCFFGLVPISTHCTLGLLVCLFVVRFTSLLCSEHKHSKLSFLFARPVNQIQSGYYRKD